MDGRSVLGSVMVMGLAALPAAAQAVISTQAGLINYTEGTVLLNDHAFSPRAGQFQQMKKQDILRTSDAGRAEVLLNPGVFLRVGRVSEVRLDSDRIDDARVGLLSGTVLVEAAYIPKGSRVTFTWQDVAVSIEKYGIYRLQAGPATLRVISGKAVVKAGGKMLEVKGGRMAALDGSGAITKFDRKDRDTLDVWSQQRSAQLAQANRTALLASRNAKDLPSTAYWIYNEVTGTYTYVPVGAVTMGPYGYSYYRDRDSVPFSDNSRNPLPASGVTTPSAVGTPASSSSGGGGPS